MAIKFFFGLTIFLIFAITIGFITSEPDVDKTPKHDEVLRDLVLHEDKVLDGYWLGGKTLRAAVENDWTDRSGYALYLCEVIKRGLLPQPVLKVEVIDYDKYYDHRTTEVLGKADCY